MVTLNQEFEAWTTEQGLSKDMDAGEMILLGVTDPQCDWLCKFIDRWEEASEYERWGALVSVGQRVELIKEVEHYQVGVFPIGETGTVTDINDEMIEVLLDRHHESLDEWENVLQIPDDSELNGAEYKPETYLRALEA